MIIDIKMDIPQEVVLNQCLPPCCEDCTEKCPHYILLFHNDEITRKKWQEVHGHFDDLSEAMYFVNYVKPAPSTYVSVCHIGGGASEDESY